MLKNHATFAVTRWMIALVCALAVSGFGAQLAQAMPPDIVGPDEGSGSPGTNPLSAGLRPMSAESGTTCVYVETFEAGDGGWTVIDPTEGEVYWHPTTYDNGGTMLGVWWCGTDSPCFAAPPGYGTNWVQQLDKTFTLPAGPVALTLEHQYDTEFAYDLCYVQITTDGGASYTTVASYTGSSGGFVTDVVDLSGYAGTTVGIRFLFTSDGGWDDQDGYIDTDGAWRLDAVSVTGSPTDDFETGGDGWTASTTPPLDIAQFRLETDPPCPDPANCENFCTSWIAYDETGVFPYTPPDLVAQGLGIGTGIESPEIPIPADATGMIMEFDVFGANNPSLNMVYYSFEVISTGTAGCEQTGWDNTVYYTGINPITFTFTRDITPYLAPGATSFRVRLLLRDLQWQYSPYYPWSGVHGEGVYFDNVAFLALGTADPGVDCDRTCGPQQPTSVTVSGTVSSDCGGPLLGVTVDLSSEMDFQTTSTDSAGMYSFTTLDVGSTGEVSVVVPLGYEAVIPADGHTAVAVDQDQTVDFSVSCLDPQGQARSMGYWKHNANVFLKNKGHAQEAQADMETNFPNAVFNHFYENGLNAIEVEGVTYMDDGGTPVPLDLATIAATLSVQGNAGMEAKAKQQYLALLLNIASGKLLTTSIVSDDGATASQALQQVADLINDGDPSNDETAKDIGDIINNAQLVPAGVIDLGYSTIAYSREIGTSRFVTLLRGPSPNPVLGATTIRFQLKEPGDARITIYDLSGRLVRSVYNQWTAAGPHEVTWDGTGPRGSRVASGIYYIRMQTKDYGATKRAVILN